MIELDKRTKDIRLWASVCHVIPYIVAVGIPLINIIAPALVWLFKRDDDEWIHLHAKTAINFQLSLTIYLVIGFLIIWLLIQAGIIGSSSYFMLTMFIAMLALFVFFIMMIAGIYAYRGDFFNYPLTIPFIKVQKPVSNEQTEV